MGTKRRLIFVALVFFGASVPMVGPASPIGVGSAETSFSLLSFSATGGVSQTIDILAGEGIASTDPAATTNHLAELTLRLALAEGEVTIDSSPLDISVRAEGPGDESVETLGLSRTLDEEPTTSAEVEVTAASADVGETSARAELSVIDVDAAIQNGLVSITGMTISQMSARSDASSARAEQTVQIQSVQMFPIGPLLENLGEDELPLVLAPLGQVPLLEIRDVVVSTEAEAWVESSDATAQVTWGSAYVAGLPVPFTNMQEAAIAISDALEAAVTQIAQGLGIQLVIELGFPSATQDAGPGDLYETAKADATAFRFGIATLPEDPEETPIALALGLLSMSSGASYQASSEPGGEDPPPGEEDPPPGEEDPPPGEEDPPPAEEPEILGSNEEPQEPSASTGVPSGTLPAPAFPAPPALQNPDLPATGGRAPALLAIAANLMLCGLFLMKLGAQMKLRPEGR